MGSNGNQLQQGLIKGDSTSKSPKNTYCTLMMFTTLRAKKKVQGGVCNFKSQNWTAYSGKVLYGIRNCLVLFSGTFSPSILSKEIKGMANGPRAHENSLKIDAACMEIISLILRNSTRELNWLKQATFP